MELYEQKKQVKEYARKCYEKGYTAGTSGNLSILSGEDRIVITPSGIEYGLIAVDDIMVIDFDGNIVSGSHKPSSEWQMHAHIYKNMSNVFSVVHTHSPYATSFAVLNKAIPTTLIEMVYFLGGDVRVAPVATQGTTEVGVGVVNALKDRKACLLQNHGVVCIGENLAEAFMRAEYVEDAAKVNHMAMALGEPTLLSEEMIRKHQKN